MSIATVGVGFEGWYKIEAIRPDGRRRLLADWFPNIITNLGLNMLGSLPIGNPAVDRCMVGTGTATPTVSDTQLQNRIATSSTVGPNGTGDAVTVGPIADHYTFFRRPYRFAAGVATGNLTEVGVGNSNTSAFSRALILDGNGNPTTITVLEDEVLDVFYELRTYASVADVTANITISGTSYATVLRPAQYPTSWPSAIHISGTSTAGMLGEGRTSGALGDASTGPGGSLVSGGSGSAYEFIGAYVNNSYQRDMRYTWGLNSGNADFHSVFLVNSYGRWKASFSPALAKRNTNILTLDLRVTWARRT